MTILSNKNDFYNIRSDKMIFNLEKFYVSFNCHICRKCCRSLNCCLTPWKRRRKMENVRGYLMCEICKYEFIKQKKILKILLEELIE